MSSRKVRNLYKSLSSKLKDSPNLSPWSQENVDKHCLEINVVVAKTNPFEHGFPVT